MRRSSARAPGLLAILLAIFSLAADLLLGRVPAVADPAPFDLLGPRLAITVSRGAETLPISQVPSLAGGDRLSIRADLPPGQSVRYLLVVGFLRGATNPPPESWFHRNETWTKSGRAGLAVTVPAGAEQAVVLLAPTAGGDFKTVVDAVRSRPGAFVRAAQDLNQASLDRSRLDAYLRAIRSSDPSDPQQLQEISPLLARSLAIKLNADCLKKEAALQAACLMENQSSLVLADTHSTSIVEALTSGSSADLITQLSDSPRAGSGYYSPYVGAVLDIARILDGFRSAQYQYLPALTVADGGALALVLNTPPSFKAPMSVLMTALPPVEAAQIPPIRPVDPKQAVCASEPGLVLPVDGAPLVFSTGYARDLKLRLILKAGPPLELRLRPAAEKGGLLLEGPAPAPGGEVADALIVGKWGFDAFEGPHVQARLPGPGPFSIAAEDGGSLVAGRDEVGVLTSRRAACVEGVALKDAAGDRLEAPLKRTGPDVLSLELPLKAVAPGAVELEIKEWGLAAPEIVPARTFAEERRLAGFDVHAGDAAAALEGARLDEVAKVSFLGVEFLPQALKRVRGEDQLALQAAPPEAARTLKAGDAGSAKIILKDGAAVRLAAEVRPARPVAALLSKTADLKEAAQPIQLQGDRQLQQGAVLTFSLEAGEPGAFPNDLHVEIAGADGAVLTSLDLAKGVVLADRKTAVAKLDTGAALGPSVFGPLMFRVVEGGAPGAWEPLATLVRTPVLKELRCPAAPAPCQLLGENLFLIDQISADPAFDHPVSVPEGFTGGALAVPRPKGRRLYLKLHDDPDVVDDAAFPEGRLPRSAPRPPPA